MKNKKIKIHKKNISKYINDNELKTLMIKYWKNVKYYLLCYIKIIQLIDTNNQSKILLKDFFDRFQDYYLNIEQNNVVQNKLFISTSIDERINYLIENYLKIFCLDFKILKNLNDLGVVYNYSRLQIRLFLSAKNIISNFFPLNLNTIIEIFNKCRKPIYEYIKIN